MIAVRLDPLIGNGGAAARLECDLPAALAADQNLFAATTRSAASGTINAGLFGSGFALRLARAEARAAGGSLRRDGAKIVLTLPVLTAMGSVPSAVGA